MPYILGRDKSFLGNPSRPMKIDDCGWLTIRPNSFTVQPYCVDSREVVIADNKLLTIHGVRLPYNTNFECPYTWQLSARLIPRSKGVSLTTYEQTVELLSTGKFSIVIEDVYIEELPKIDLMERLVILLKYFGTGFNIKKVNCVKDIIDYCEGLNEYKYDGVLLKRVNKPIGMYNYVTREDFAVVVLKAKLGLLKESMI